MIAEFSNIKVLKITKLIFQLDREVIMMKEMLYESELKVLELLWKEGDITAKDLSIKLNESIAWNKSTTYTIIKRCVDKGLIERLEPDFTCRATLTKEEARKQESEILADKMFDGSSDLLIASLLGNSKMTTAQIEKLQKMVQEFNS